MPLQVRAATATALGVVAARAKLLADQEDREIEQKVASIIETQVILSVCLFSSHMIWMVHALVQLHFS